jgi:hypothetical protein
VRCALRLREREKEPYRRADIITPEEGFELLIFMGARLRSEKILMYNIYTTDIAAQGRQQVLWNILDCWWKKSTKNTG